jgi:hypothetical protein
MPWTPQELAVKELLIENRLPFEAHHVFELSGKIRMSVDLLIFSGPGMVLECTFCSKGRGSAMSEVRRRCAFIEYRFRLLKSHLTRLNCGVLIEAPKEDQTELYDVVSQVARNADFRILSLEQLAEQLGRIIINDTKEEQRTNNSRS